MFNIVLRKEAKVAHVLSVVPINVEFRRALVGRNHIVARVANINLQHGNDVFVWRLQKSGLFTVNSMYSHLVCNGLKVSQSSLAA